MPTIVQQILDRASQIAWHLWAAPRNDVPVECPIIEGFPPDPTGFMDAATVARAYAWTGWWSLAGVGGLIVACYLFTRYSTGPKFDQRWAIFGGASAVLAFVIPLVVLTVSETRAEAGTCETDLSPFVANMPIDVTLVRASAGLIWGPLAFLALSLILTKTLGRFVWSRGFFHNSGSPWPRILRPKE